MKQRRLRSNKKELENIENQIFESQNTISDIRTSIEKTEGNNKVLSQQIDHCLLDINRLKNESIKLDAKIEEVNKENKELSAKFNGVSLELKARRNY